MNNYKIGILTFSYPENMNFGAMLQAYALYTFLEKEGFNPYIIDYFEPKKKSILKPKYKPRRLLGMSGFNKFFFKNFPNRTHRCSNSEELEALNNKFDCFIVGSDQIWRYRWLRDKITHYFLDFARDNAKKIAYAASFGKDEWDEAPNEITQKLQNLIQRFNNISVREKSGIDICKNTFNADATHVLDPTLLLSIEDYNALIEKNEKLPGSKYTGFMVLERNPKYNTIINELSEKLSAPAIDIRGKIFSKNFIKYNSISQWINNIKNAEFIVTDSFHCVVFSLIFNKQFICLGNPQRGLARMETLLSMYNLQDRIILDFDNLDIQKLINNPIDYKNIDKSAIELKQNESASFLVKALKQ